MLQVIHGDCLDVLPTLGERFAACVTDPPYHLGEVPHVKRGGFGGERSDERRAARSGFMGKQWDGGDIAFRSETWRAVFDALLPGGHLVCFGGTRTWHRMACAIEDAGFEMRDTLCWLYGQGFPKSLNPGEQMDRDWWDETEWERGDRSHRSVYWGRFGTALKPAWEPIILARKPLTGTVAANVLAHGTGALNVDACRVGTETRTYKPSAVPGGNSQRMHGGDGRDADIARSYGEESRNRPATTVEGRWPANLLHDGSAEVEAAFAAFGSSTRPQPRFTKRSPDSGNRTGYGAFGGQSEVVIGAGDTGTASRFFFSAKASAADRADSRHPTVKPVDLMRWLVRLVTPPGGAVLDPFAGSGTTGEAAMLEGFDATLIERDATHAADIAHRIKRWSGEDAPLFAQAAD